MLKKENLKVKEWSAQTIRELALWLLDIVKGDPETRAEAKQFLNDINFFHYFKNDPKNDNLINVLADLSDLLSNDYNFYKNNKNIYDSLDHDKEFLENYAENAAYRRHILKIYNMVKRKCLTILAAI